MNTKQKSLNSSNKSLKFQGDQQQELTQQSLQEDQTLETEGSKEVTSQTQTLASKDKAKFTQKSGKLQLVNPEAEHLQAVTERWF